MKSALIVIDVQHGLFENEPRPHEADEVVDRINALVARARGAGVPVFFVQHERQSGFLEFGSASWALQHRLDVQPSDFLIRKTTPDSFLRTELGTTLESLGVGRLAICGYATEFCVDTTTRRAAALSYEVVLASDAHTTHDKAHASAEQIRTHHNATLPNITSFGPTIVAVKADEVQFGAQTCWSDRHKDGVQSCAALVPMHDLLNLREPEAIAAIWADTRAAGFNMASEPLTCALLRTLAATKPSARFLELGSGTGLSTAWLLDGMDSDSHLTTVDNDESLLAILKKHLVHDPRLTVVCADGDEFLRSLRGQQFDFIFADTWSGKYRLLEEALELLRPSGLYVIDDMLPQPNWPDGHAEKVADLIDVLEQRKDFRVTKLSWASGVILAAKVQAAQAVA
jgi:nicotinamidase-related amidase/predicted O-methyltransferase YrrM